MALKKLLNSRERETVRLLDAVGQRRGAQTFAKVRVADVLPIDHSGIDDDLFGYAMRAHFDVVVADPDSQPLFAVEFDGPAHDEAGAKENDRKKNALCERFACPLARIRDEHLFGSARRLNYLEWLAEMYFGMRDLVRAQDEGLIPWDEPLDPMSFASVPDIKGTFPLFISAALRTKLERYKNALLAPRVIAGGEDAVGWSHAISFIADKERAAWAESSIYLRGFNFPSFEVVEEIAVVKAIRAFLGEKGARGVVGRQADLHRALISFLRAHPAASPRSIGGSGRLDFDMQWALVSGCGRWRIGPLGDEPGYSSEAR